MLTPDFFKQKDSVHNTALGESIPNCLLNDYTPVANRFSMSAWVRLHRDQEASKDTEIKEPPRDFLMDSQAAAYVRQMGRFHTDSLGEGSGFPSTLRK